MPGGPDFLGTDRIPPQHVADALLREAVVLAEALDDPRRLGQVLCFLSVHFTTTGAQYAQAIAAAQRVLALATASGDAALHALAHY
jgi:hypothetical protein